jgi:hypothetical protein
MAALRAARGAGVHALPYRTWAWGLRLAVGLQSVRRLLT